MWCAVRMEQAAVVGAALRIAEEMDGGGGIARPVPPDANVEGDDGARAEGLMREVLSKLVDLRGVARPPLFTGAVGDWNEFRFRMENVASLLGLEDFMEKAARGEGEEVPGRDAEQVLVQPARDDLPGEGSCTGAAGATSRRRESVGKLGPRV